MGWNPIKEAEKKAKQAVDKIIKPATDAAEKAIWKLRRESWAKIQKLGNDVEKKVKSAGNKVEDEVKDVGEDLEENLKKVGHDLEKDLTEKLPELMEEHLKDLPEMAKDEILHAMSELAKLTQSEVYKKAASFARTAHKELGELRDSKPKLVDYIDAQPIAFHIGPATITYQNFYNRAENITMVLDRLANEPPQFRRSTLIAAVEAMGPDSTDLGVSVNFALVAGSDALGGGFALPEIPLELVTEIMDWVLKEIGVPE